MHRNGSVTQLMTKFRARSVGGRVHLRKGRILELGGAHAVATNSDTRNRVQPTSCLSQAIRATKNRRFALGTLAAWQSLVRQIN